MNEEKMKKQGSKNIRNNKMAAILRLCFLAIVSVGWIVLQSFVGNNSYELSILLVVAITVLIFVTYLLTSKFLLYVLGISNVAFATISEEEMCPNYNNICCVNLAIDSLKSAYRIRLDDNAVVKYGLYSEEQLIEIEGRMEQGEVWIVSYDLTAETLENQQSRIRERNINKKIKYRLFYINDDAQKYGELQDNIKLLDRRYNQKMKLYPYEKPISIFSFLFSLFGIIMFINEEGRVNEAFFTLYSSNEKIKEPIYIKMSYCMEQKYNKILYSIMKAAKESRRKRP